MRITFLTQWFDPEPGQFRGLPLARELVRHGHEVQVVTGFPNYPEGRLYPGYRLRHWQREMLGGVPVLRVPLYPSHDRNPVRRIANYASFAASATVLGTALAERSDALYVYHPPPTVGIPAAVFRGVRRVPVVYHIADMWPESAVESGMLATGIARRAASFVIGEYCKWVYGVCDAITVLSPGFKRLLVERGVEPSKIEVVYNWADDELFRPLPRNEDLARELGLSGKFNVIYAGNVGAFQGLDTVIKAAPLLREAPDVQIVLAGTGVEEARLRALADQLRVTNVRFLGHRPISQMPAINALADVLLVHLRDLPFFRTTIPGKTQVSLASGRPVIMAVEGDAADVVRWAEAGRTIPPENPQALASAILELRAMPRESLEKLGARGRDYYVREMSLAAGAERMIEVFERVLQGHVFRRSSGSPEEGRASKASHSVA